ncbi:hypothetical protein VCHENC02_0852B, partial [Vibrio harveyi]
LTGQVMVTSPYDNH